MLILKDTVETYVAHVYGLYSFCKTVWRALTVAAIVLASAHFPMLNLWPTKVVRNVTDFEIYINKQDSSWLWGYLLCQKHVSWRIRCASRK